MTVRNEVASAANWYWPGSMFSRTKFPYASLVAWRIAAPAALVSVTCAPATVAPFGSRTLPEMRLASVAERFPQTRINRLSTQAAMRLLARISGFNGCIQKLRGRCSDQARTANGVFLNLSHEIANHAT